MAEQPDPPPRFRAIQINALGSTTSDWTQAFGINNLGHVTGRLNTTGLPPRGFAWLPDGAYNLAAGLHPMVATGTGHFGSIGFAINDNGRVAGWRGHANFSLSSTHLNIWNLPAHSGTGDIVGEEIDEAWWNRVAINNDDVAVGVRSGSPGGYRVPRHQQR